MLSARQRRRLGALHRRKGRQQHGLFLVEGPRLVAEALGAGWRLEEAFYDPEDRSAAIAALVGDLETRGVATFPAPRRALAAVADAATPQGILATAALPRPPGEGAIDDAAGPVLVVDGVQDPGNVGALLRTADAYGASPVFLLAGTADPLNPKAVRGSMGAIFHVVMVVEVDPDAAVPRLQDRGFRVFASVPRGGMDHRRLPTAGRRALLVGGEGAGLSPARAASADARVTIRTPGRAESLNVVVAAGVLLDRMVSERAGGRPPAGPTAPSAS